MSTLSPLSHLLYRVLESVLITLNLTQREFYTVSGLEVMESYVRVNLYSSNFYINQFYTSKTSPYPGNRLP